MRHSAHKGKRKNTPFWSSCRRGNSSSDSPTTTQRPQRKKRRCGLRAAVGIHHQTLPLRHSAHKGKKKNTPLWPSCRRGIHHQTLPLRHSAHKGKILRCDLRTAVGIHHQTHPLRHSAHKGKRKNTPLWSSCRRGNSSSDSPTTTQRPQRKKLRCGLRTAVGIHHQILPLRHSAHKGKKKNTPLWPSCRRGNSSSDSPTTTQRPQRKKEKYAVVAFVPPRDLIHYLTK